MHSPKRFATAIGTKVWITSSSERGSQGLSAFMAAGFDQCLDGFDDSQRCIANHGSCFRLRCLSRFLGIGKDGFKIIGWCM